MTRKKVKLQYITNDSARKATFKKRKAGLMKKVSELSTLCGIKACAIICSPYDSQPEVWPSALGVQRVLSEFKMFPEMDQGKKMVNQESFIRQQISKASNHFKRQSKDNREEEMTQVMSHCLVGNLGLQHLNIVDLNDLRWSINQRQKDIKSKIETLRAEKTQNAEDTTVTTEIQDINVNPHNQANISNQHQWFVDFMDNPHTQMGFEGEDLIFNNFNNNTSVWSNNFFP